MYIDSYYTDDALEILFTNDDLWSTVKSHMTNQSLGCEVRASATLVIANMARNGIVTYK